MRNELIPVFWQNRCSSLLLRFTLGIFLACAAGDLSAEEWGYDSLDLASGGYNGGFTRVTTSSDYIWYQRIEQGNPTATGDQWLKFHDNGNWNKQWGVYNATTLTPANDSVFTDAIDAGGMRTIYGLEGDAQSNVFTFSYFSSVPIPRLFRFK